MFYHSSAGKKIVNVIPIILFYYAIITSVALSIVIL